jgi:hypothetical protein
MANSRSNIYPVQLQGAELNLNKYDAEIKQYSGFNKNNSPFVGGCLSNVFHKEEQITGGNADNTYIDTNGDVYRVTTEGLFKNGEKLIDYTGKKFYDVVECKTQFPANTVYVDSEECYITVDYTTSNSTYQRLEGYLNIYNPFNKIWEQAEFPQVISIALTDKIDFYTKSCKTEDCILTFIGYRNNGSYKINIFKTSADGTEFVGSTLTLTCYHFFFHLEQLNDEGGILSIFINSPTYSTGIFYKNYSFDMEGNLTFIEDVMNDGFIASETKLYKIYHNGNTSRYESVIYDYVLSNGALITSNPVNIDYGESKVFSGSNSKTPNVIKDKPFGFLLTHRISIQDTSYYYVFGLCDFITPYLSAANNNYVINTGCVTGEYILYNNGVVSGICLPGGYVLASEWNTVNENNIYVQSYKKNYNGVYNPSECEVIYKTGDKWVKLIESTPKLKKCVDQIVVNTNHYHNSYDIKRNKKLLFAPAWNNRLPRNSFFQSDNSILENTKFVASAINEYNLKDNSSIILNPIPVVYDIIPLRNPNAITLEIENNIYVDFYKTWDTKEGIIYYKSMVIEDLILDRPGFVFDYLEDLPFPSDTNGNVSYSPSIFAKFISSFGNDVFVKEGSNVYQLSRNDNQPIMSYYLGTLIEGLEEVFILQGQYYGVINNQIFAIQFYNGVVASQTSVVSVENLQFVGNTPYEALFFSKTNRCLYSFTGANVLNQKQLVDKISEVTNYLYNPATQTVFLITDIGVLFYGLFGMFLLEYTDITNIFLLDNGIVMSDNSGNYRYIKYYLDEGDEGYTKENIRLDTCFYGMNNEVVTINDCLYFRLFSEEHEEGNLKVSATTISLRGRKTEETTFKIKASDWDKITHTIYLRYQPKAQRGLGVSFSIDSPFKIASMSVGSQPDAVLVDKVSKGAITAPSVTTNNNEW